MDDEEFYNALEQHDDVSGHDGEMVGYDGDEMVGYDGEDDSFDGMSEEEVIGRARRILNRRGACRPSRNHPALQSRTVDVATGRSIAGPSNKLGRTYCWAGEGKQTAAGQILTVDAKFQERARVNSICIDVWRSVETSPGSNVFENEVVSPSSYGVKSIRVATIPQFVTNGGKLPGSMFMRDSTKTVFGFDTVKAGTDLTIEIEGLPVNAVVALGGTCRAFR